MAVQTVTGALHNTIASFNILRAIALSVSHGISKRTYVRTLLVQSQLRRFLRKVDWCVATQTAKKMRNIAVGFSVSGTTSTITANTPRIRTYVRFWWRRSLEGFCGKLIGVEACRQQEKCVMPPSDLAFLLRQPSPLRPRLEHVRTYVRFWRSSSVEDFCKRSTGVWLCKQQEKMRNVVVGFSVSASTTATAATMVKTRTYVRTFLAVMPLERFVRSDIKRMMVRTITEGLHNIFFVRQKFQLLTCVLLSSWPKIFSMPFVMSRAWGIMRTYVRFYATCNPEDFDERMIIA